MAWRRKSWTVGATAEERTPAELDRSDDLSRAGWPHATDMAQLIEARSRQSMHATGGVDEPVGKLERIGITGTAANHECKELIVPKTVSPEPCQLFPRPVVWC